MLLEFAQLEERDPRLAQKTTQVISHLLRHQFLHVEDRGSAPMLETLQRATSGKLVADYFDVAGYRLVVRESEGWAGILPDTERISPARMRLDETLLLLLLHRLWEEALQQGDVQARGTVLLTLNQAYDAYQEIVSLGRRPAITISAFQDLVENLERKAIVSLGPMEEDMQDMELSIRPIVAAIAGDDFVTTLEQLLQRDAQVDDESDVETDTAGERQDA
jgi:hypothetical protein